MQKDDFWGRLRYLVGTYMPDSTRTDPAHAIVIGTFEHVPLGTFVWILESDLPGDMVRVEYRSQHHRGPRSSLRTVPVPAPTLDMLVTLDSCFAHKEQLVLTHHDDRYFEVLACPHHRTFLSDIRGGVAMYERLILVEPEHRFNEPEAIWKHYHSLSDDWLNHLGIAL